MKLLRAEPMMGTRGEGRRRPGTREDIRENLTGELLCRLQNPFKGSRFSPRPRHTLSPYPFLCPSQIQTLGLLFVNVGFYSRSAPGWKGGGGTSHAQPWSSSSTSQCWARVSGRDAEWATVPGKCPHQVGRRDRGGSETPSVCHTAAWGRELGVDLPYPTPASPFKLPCRQCPRRGLAA